MIVNPRSSTRPWRIGLAAVLITGLAAPMPVSAATADVESQKSVRRAPLAYKGGGGPLASVGKIDVMVQLADAPAAQVYAAARTPASGSGTAASPDRAAVAAAKSRVAAIESAQQAVVSAVGALGGQVIFRTQRVYNGVAVKIDARQVRELRKLPGVISVRRMVPQQRDNATSVPFIRAPQAWIKGLGYRGEGIKVGIIDTGIDYLHTNFGGPGSGYGSNNTTVVGDVPNYPGTKVAGGYDFAGDAYDGDTIPAPDSDPMDCNGHGSHVSGTAGGYGVNADGTTFTGIYGDGTPFSSLRIGPGVAPKATLYGLRVFGCSGSTNLTTQALEWAMDPNGDGDFSDHLDVVNMSLGSSFGSPEDPSAVASDNAAAAGVLVVASAGNSGDTHFITGSPGVSRRTISVASAKDTNNPSSFLLVNSPSAVAGFKQATEAGDAASVSVTGPVTADLQGATPADGCTALTGFTPGRIAGVNRGGCTFQVKMTNAEAAGAAALLVANNAPGLLFMAGSAGIPAWMITQADGNAIKDQLVLGETVNVTLSAENRGALPVAEQSDTASTFTSRGPSRGGSLKPDVASMGNTILSTEHGSGSYGVSFDGTSMAAPHVAGTMALLRQIHPAWSVTELKALVMNTSLHNVFLTTSSTLPVVAPGRVGAGRQNVEKAATSGVVAYADDSTGRVSVSFGVIDVSSSNTWTVPVVVVNKGGISRSFGLAYVSQATAAGVTVAPSVSSIAVAGNSTATFDVVLTANPANMKHNREASMSSSQTTPFGGFTRAWQTEEAGYVTLTPTTTGTALRVPVHAMTRPASNMGTSSELDISSGTGTANVDLSGTGVNTGAAFPTDIVSLVSAFELQESSAEITPGVGPDDSADLKEIGVMTTNASDPIVSFGIATWGAWDSPNAFDTEFDIYLDTDRDGSADWVVFNWDLGAAGAGATTDVFYSVACDLVAGGCFGEQRINNISPGTRDTNHFNNSVISIPVFLSDLGITGAFDYYVLSFNRESGLVDSTDLHTYDPTAVGLSVTGGTFGGLVTNVFTDANGGTIPVSFNRANYEASGSQGLLLLHHHNAAGNRAEVVSVSTTAPPVVPAISITDATVPEGNVGSSNATFTVSLSGATTNTVTVRVDTADGTATAPGDYTAQSAVIVTFNPGDVSKTVDVAVAGDRVVEGDETFLVNLSAASNATIADNQGLGTITDDDNGLGDFNNDGHADILWYNTGTGNLAVWNMDGANRINAVTTTPAGYAPSTGNTVAGVGDFNDDRKSDIVWQNANTGNLTIWFMNGTSRTAGSGTTPAGYVDRKVVSIADFDADGKADDILWRNPTTGALNIWFMTGTNRTSGATTSPAGYAPATNWTLVGAADFNADGFADILWRNSADGRLFVWFMQANGVRSSGSYVTPNGLANLQWKVDAIGDYDADGKADLVYRNVSTGAVVIWFMDGVNRTSSAATTPAGYAPATGYLIAGPR